MILRSAVNDSKYFQVMDLLGPSLDDVFESMKRKFTLRTVLLIALQAFDRLHYLHSRGVVHGDVKGENFLIGLPNEGLDTGKKNDIQKEKIHENQEESAIELDR